MCPQGDQNHSMSQSPSIGDLFDALSTARCRYVLYLLLENEYSNVTDLALQIAAWEEDRSVEEVSDGEHERVSLSLMHNHLPRLADYGFVEYDRRSGDIVRAAGFEAVDDAVEQVREIDSEVDLTVSSVESALYGELPGDGAN